MSIASDKISVFPSTRRAMADPEYRSSRLVSEGAIIDTNNRVLDKTSFVITNNITDAVEVGYPFEFVIFGYHFSVTAVSDILSTIEPSLLVDGVSIYASIELDTENGISELVGQDESNEYNGITFSTVAPTVPVSGDVIKTLKILTRDSGNYYVPAESVEKYNIFKMSGSIDCGEIL